MSIIREIHTTDWNTVFSQEIQNTAINALESGNILLMPQLAFTLLPHEIDLLSPVYTHHKTKQISFEHKTGLVRGIHQCSPIQKENIKQMMQRFSQNALQLIQKLFAPYSDYLQIGRTSLRTVEIAGRITSYRKDDTRLHVDAFPSAPIQGRRILRVFTNINPEGINRVWRAGEPFEDVAKRFAPLTYKPWRGSATLLKLFKITKSYRTLYDAIMLQIHDKMKADLHYQKTVSQSELHFAPQTSWIVQTDHVSHAAISGQHVLEQTFYLPIDAMINPELSPLRVLERMMGQPLVNF